MAEHVCPWWIGYLLVSPIRRWLQNPDKILSPYVSEGMTVLELGPGWVFSQYRRPVWSVRAAG